MLRSGHGVQRRRILITNVDLLRARQAMIGRIHATRTGRPPSYRPGETWLIENSSRSDTTAQVLFARRPAQINRRIFQSTIRARS